MAKPAQYNNHPHLISPATERETDRPRDYRLPPGQTLVKNFPVLSYGPTPRFNPSKWDFRLIGLVENPLRLNWEEFRRLAVHKQTSDFHCVTSWSRYHNRWEGVRVNELMRLVTLKPQAHFVFVHCDGGYTTNLQLDEF